jgi:hypothetical protein
MFKHNLRIRKSRITFFDLSFFTTRPVVVPVLVALVVVVGFAFRPVMIISIKRKQDVLLSTKDK